VMLSLARELNEARSSSAGPQHPAERESLYIKAENERSGS